MLDTPGILDRPLEERNTIEMQSITALAHLRAAALYLVDISEQCGYSLAQQAALFHSIKPLFANKPVMIIINKTDVRSLESLGPEERGLVEGMEAEARRMSGGAASTSGSSDEPHLMCISTLQELGLMEVKQAACDRLLNFRVEVKVAGKRIHDVLNRMHVAMPKPRAGAGRAGGRAPVIPPSVLAARAAEAAGAVAAAEKRKLEKDMQEEHGGAGERGDRGAGRGEGGREEREGRGKGEKGVGRAEGGGEAARGEGGGGKGGEGRSMEGQVRGGGEGRG